MSETPVEQPTETPQAAAGAPKLEDLLADLPDDARKAVLGEVSKARSEAKGLRARVREAEPQLQELAQLRQSQQTEAERWQSFGQEQEKRATTAARDAMRYKVALEHGLTADDLQFIHGDDEDQILASAEALHARLGQVQQTSTTPRTPLPDLSQGSSAGTTASADPAQQFAAILTQHLQGSR